MLLPVAKLLRRLTSKKATSNLGAIKEEGIINHNFPSDLIELASLGPTKSTSTKQSSDVSMISSNLGSDLQAPVYSGKNNQKLNGSKFAFATPVHSVTGSIGSLSRGVTRGSNGNIMLLSPSEARLHPKKSFIVVKRDSDRTVSTRILSNPSRITNDPRDPAKRRSSLPLITATCDEKN